ncbi:MAG: hydroxymethylglutaryl-CoA lyase [Clostridia bacterium]|nr:hydroxymethylglutaryl-CoA lyase [Clostridia bacterium]
MYENLSVIDVTLRDGLQHEEVFVKTEAKLWLANKLIEAGVRRIEVGTFSHVKYVPQFKDVEAVLAGLPKRDDVEYTVLALNRKACERLAGELEKGAQIDRVLVGQLATSEAYARKNMNRTHEELFAEAEKNVAFLHSLGIKKVMANVGTIFGCPIQGKMPLQTAYDFCDRVFNIGFDEIEHSDTDGIAAPNTVYEYFSEVLRRYPDPAKHSFHVHDVRGMGLAVYYAAAEAGVRTFDVSLGGIGGQVANIVDGVPVKGTGAYYFEGCRTGLVETCDFVAMLEEMGVKTGIDPAKLIAAEKMLEKILGRPLDSFTAKLG